MVYAGGSRSDAYRAQHTPAGPASERSTGVWQAGSGSDRSTKSYTISSAARKDDLLAEERRALLQFASCVRSPRKLWTAGSDDLGDSWTLLTAALGAAERLVSAAHLATESARALAVPIQVR